MFKDVLRAHQMNYQTHVCACGWVLESSLRGCEPAVEHLDEMLAAEVAKRDLMGGVVHPAIVLVGLVLVVGVLIWLALMSPVIATYVAIGAAALAGAYAGFDALAESLTKRQEEGILRSWTDTR